MEIGDAREMIRLLTQIADAQAANLDIQRKLLDTVVAQSTSSEERSTRIIERTSLLQDRTMDTLILNRRLVSYGLPIFAVVVVLLLWRFALG
jgi:hypothetical protein